MFPGKKSPSNKWIENIFTREIIGKQVILSGYKCHTPLKKVLLVENIDFIDLQIISNNRLKIIFI